MKTYKLVSACVDARRLLRERSIWKAISDNRDISLTFSGFADYSHVRIVTRGLVYTGSLWFTAFNFGFVFKDQYENVVKSLADSK